MGWSAAADAGGDGLALGLRVAAGSSGGLLCVSKFVYGLRDQHGTCIDSRQHRHSSNSRDRLRRPPGRHIRTGRRVTAVRSDGAGLAVDLEGGGRLRARAVVAATGGFGSPHRPDLSGLEAFAGQVLHAADYRSPAPFAGRRVVVVGAGNSAVQTAAELARESRTSLAARAPVKFARQHLAGKGLHSWLTRTGLAAAPLGRLLKTRPPLRCWTTAATAPPSPSAPPTGSRCSAASPTTGSRGPTAPRSGWTR
ncbi:NAD(P)-binding domain-containing protein [Streptomyces virginiae]|uniref:NAD(P)-binding domain-containing protein n=1 Tax=Streptomyces virginiae TaxID=1961 RepID=UPI003455DBE0